MELKIKPSLFNQYPLAGLLIKGATIEQWLKEIQWMELSLSAIKVYPVPGVTANSIWGCLVVLQGTKPKEIGRNMYCQLANDLLFIPERSCLFPEMIEGELEKLLKNKPHLFHPEIGLVELNEVVEWANYLVLPSLQSPKVKAPMASVFIPGQIKSFQIKPITSEEALEALEEKFFPKREAFTDKPLNLFEKAKLFFYQQLFTSNNKVEGEDDKPSAIMKALNSISQLFSKKGGSLTKEMEMDYEDLERRNQKHLDRLLDLLKNNPEEALKYAIPLDMDGAARGSHKPGSFDLQKRWFDFSLFGNSGGNFGSGTSVLPDDSFAKLQQQYRATAQELIKQKQYEKAAFVYIKLLKDYNQAAQTLENGGLYEAAASVYLKYSNNKRKAAECYEKGRMTTKAIDLYKELDENEKVGDLYCSIEQRKDGYVYYKKVVDAYVYKEQYVKASLLCRNKMGDVTAAQSALLTGWRANKDAFNCLNNYFANIEDVKQLGQALQTTYQQELTVQNKETFLRVLQHEFLKKNELAESIKDMAHEIIVQQAVHNPSIVSELHFYNKTDKQLIKDTMRYKINRKNKE